MDSRLLNKQFEDIYFVKCKMQECKNTINVLYGGYCFDCKNKKKSSDKNCEHIIDDLTSRKCKCKSLINNKYCRHHIKLYTK